MKRTFEIFCTSPREKKHLHFYYHGPSRKIIMIRDGGGHADPVEADELLMDEVDVEDLVQIEIILYENDQRIHKLCAIKNGYNQKILVSEGSEYWEKKK